MIDYEHFVESRMLAILESLIAEGVGRPSDKYYNNRKKRVFGLGDVEIPYGAVMKGKEHVIQLVRAALAKHEKYQEPTVLYGTHEDVVVPALYGAANINEYGQARVGDWIQTASGIKFHPLDIQPEDIDIDDIAHALSLVNRFTGHTTRAYSVAEHSVRCMWAVDNLLANIDESIRVCWRERLLLTFEALMHDASEAYVADLARPIKMMPQMQSYRDMEAVVEKAIRAKYGLPKKMSPIVKRADEIMLRTEARDLMGPLQPGWIFREQALPAVIKPWSADLAEYRFKEEYYNLLEKLGIEG
jgi:5'-nucleotidase